MANCCVFCYKEKAGQRRVTKTVRGRDFKLKTFIRVFERYINEPFQKGRKNGSKVYADNEGENGTLVEFLFEEALKSGMEVCEECCKLMDSFCELYHKLKTTELLLNWKVWMLKGALEAGQNNSKNVSTLRNAKDELILDKRFWSSGDEIIELLQELNNQMIKKCSQKLGSSFPVLSISRCQLPTGAHSEHSTLDDIQSVPPGVNNVESDAHCSDSDISDLDHLSEDSVFLPITVQRKTISDKDSFHLQNDTSMKTEPVQLKAVSPDHQSTDTSHQDLPSDNLLQIKTEHDGNDNNNIDDHSKLSQLETETCANACNGNNYQTLENVKRTQKNDVMIKTNVDTLLTDSSSSRRLRTVHRCQYCSRTFSSSMRLLEHQKDCQSVEKTIGPDDEDHASDTNSFQANASSKDNPYNPEDDNSHISDEENNFIEDNPVTDEDTKIKELLPTEEVLQPLKLIGANRKVRCPVCQTQRKLNRIISHIKLKHPEKAPDVIVKCKICDREFHSMRARTIHTLNRHTKEKKPWKIRKNKKPNAKYFRFRTSVLRCPICFMYRKPDRIVAHIKLRHADKASTVIFKCPVCPREFLTKGSISSHMSRKHPAEYSKNKETDEYLFSQESKCMTIMGTKKWICPLCLRSFGNKSGLSRHIGIQRSHHAMWRSGRITLERTHPRIDLSAVACTVCQRKSYRSCGLDLHMEFAHSVRSSMEPGVNIEKLDLQIGNESNKKRAKVSLQGGSSLLEEKAPRAGKPNSIQTRYRYKCVECPELFQRLHKAIQHKSECHSNSENGIIKVEIVVFPENPVSSPSDDFTETEYSTYATIEVDDASFVCPVTSCRKHIYNAEDMEWHRKLHGTFPCVLCDFVAEYAPDLSSHEREHMRSGGRLSECVRCFREFESVGEYTEHHLSEHLSLRWAVHCCAICRTPYPSLRGWAIFRHYRNVHNLDGVKPKSIRRCEVESCKAYFSTVPQLLKHQSKVHNIKGKELKSARKGQYRCSICSRGFGSQFQLDSHRERKHSSDINFLHCSYKGCSKKYETEDDLACHISSRHTSESAEECEKCGKVFYSKGHMKQHMTNHKKWDSKSKVKAATPIFTCNLCDKSFKKKERWRRHLLWHEPQENWEYTCESCGKKFPLKDNLKSHAQVHSKDNKRFVCTVCGQAYAHRHNLRIHVNSKHSDVMQDIPMKMDSSNHKRKIKKTGAKSNGPAGDEAALLTTQLTKN